MYSIGRQEMIILNEAGIEIESPKSHLITDIDFDHPRQILMKPEGLGYFRAFYPRGDGGRKVEYRLGLSTKFLISNTQIRLAQAVAFMIPFTLNPEKMSSILDDCDFVIVVKAAAPRPVIGIWRYESSDPYSLDGFRHRVKWDRERNYPTFKRID